MLAPTQIIINGPSATLGKEFKIVKYGSTILAINLFHQRIVAITNPSKLPKQILINNSYKVIPMC